MTRTGGTGSCPLMAHYGAGIVPRGQHMRRAKKRAVRRMWREYASLTKKYHRNADWGYSHMAAACLRAMDEMKKRIDEYETELEETSPWRAFAEALND